MIHKVLSAVRLYNRTHGMPPVQFKRLQNIIFVTFLCCLSNNETAIPASPFTKLQKKAGFKKKDQFLFNNSERSMIENDKKNALNVQSSEN